MLDAAFTNTSVAFSHIEEEKNNCNRTMQFQSPAKYVHTVSEGCVISDILVGLKPKSKWSKLLSKS